MYIEENFFCVKMYPKGGALFYTVIICLFTGLFLESSFLIGQTVLDRVPIFLLKIDSGDVKTLLYRGQTVVVFNNYIEDDSSAEYSTPDNLPDGKYVVFYKKDTSRLAIEANYHNGKKNGIQKGFYLDGKINYSINYKDGNREGSFSSYYKSGQIKLTASYKNNNLIESHFYFPNGMLNKKTVCKKDNCNSEEYKEDGNIIKEKRTKNKEIYKEYNIKGDIIKKECYKHGKLIYMRVYRRSE
jgi:antitoxin component YwqK of YwqJK toxin-antitoxin module